MIKNCKECGKEFKTKPYLVKIGQGKFCSKICRGISNRNDLIGRVFGRLTVVSFKERKIYKRTTNAIYNVLCECGEFATAGGKSLVKGATTSCGCYSKESHTRPFGVACIGIHYSEYKVNARKKARSFDLSKEDFNEIVLKNCFYCGSEPRLMFESRKNKMNGRIPLNGIDRKDNHVGYTVENSVPCCTKCNRMKLALGVDEFLSHIEKINCHQKSNGISFPISYLTVIS